ncbi:hypothetical protein LB577_20285 [Mesorhizobium sp. B283B1A]|uniref:Uncharacterized protein n=4 Tax=Mesorhizobium TaxID=68287 RepID=L0KT90_MESAW|nr:MULTISPECIES: hypothetical protein [Mesorhizobium]AEH90530.1 hypothetical protein Mesop_6129 [Mesorhizobium opportunistum WSM2075]ADV14644.1 hypothetical protein Mesci_5547 [Mesorhizobium ciceri biovar biserrulae WSM1271]AGB47900.1 hypothetical protein Mesau_05596 [Mesorhizobium australicum WSM2073]MCA0049262.1 hypothetical protein [Mesorhizobium sp. B283B1A]OBP89997.1 hypothetical protein BAE40_13960 [Mesorhizobium loti]
MSQLLSAIFKPDGREEAERAKFLSRMFGIFSEKIVSLWCDDERSPYQDIGRPTIKTSTTDRGYTLDFTLRERKTDAVYVAEMKCEIEYQSFRYFILTNAEQLKHHRKPAFNVFLRSARPSEDLQAWVCKQKTPFAGAILIWGAVSPSGRMSAIQEFGLRDALSLDEMSRDLISWKCQRYEGLLSERRAWSNQLFDGLLSSASVGEAE